MNLVEEVEKAFEPRALSREDNLANWVSDKLMSVMPRISPDLFKRKRIAKLSLSPSEKERFDKGAVQLVENLSKDWRERWSEARLETEFTAEIPMFALGYLKNWERQEICIGYGNLKQTLTLPSINLGQRLNLSNTNGHNLATFGPSYHAHLEPKLIWAPEQRSSVNVEVPSVPDNIRDISYTAIDKYNRILQSANPQLRRGSIPTVSQLGVLWAPTDDSLRTNTEQIAHAQITKEARGRDPILVLAIPNNLGERYHHVIASWNIGEELPFKNWIAEYTEGGLR